MISPQEGSKLLYMVAYPKLQSCQRVSTVNNKEMKFLMQNRSFYYSLDQRRIMDVKHPAKPDGNHCCLLFHLSK